MQRPDRLQSLSRGAEPRRERCQTFEVVFDVPRGLKREIGRSRRKSVLVPGAGLYVPIPPFPRVKIILSTGNVTLISKREINLSGTFLQLFIRKGGKK